MPFTGLRETLVETLGNHHSEYCITQVFKTLIIDAARTAVGQCLFEQGEMLKLKIQLFCQVFSSKFQRIGIRAVSSKSITTFMLPASGLLSLYFTLI